MATRIEYEVLYGENAKGPVCSILEIDNFVILLDCGWDDHFNTELLKPIEKARSQHHDILAEATLMNLQSPLL